MLEKVYRGGWRAPIVTSYCLLLMQIGCASVTPRTTEQKQSIFDGCSMEALLATPERYDGRWVQVVGYARVEFEYQALFPLREYDEAGI